MLSGFTEFLGNKESMLPGLIGFTPPRNKPSTNVFVPFIPVRDPFFGFVEFLIGEKLEDASSGSTSILSDKNNYTVTGQGTAEILQVEDKAIGGGVSKSLGHIANNNITDYWNTGINPLTIGSQDYTLELFFQQSNGGINPFLFELLTPGDATILRLQRVNAGGGSQRIELLYNGSPILQPTTGYADNTSYYVCVQRNIQGSPTTVMYVNGTQIGSVTNQSSLGEVDELRLMSFAEQFGRNANIGQVRLTVGVARYTLGNGSNPVSIPVPTSPFPSK